jgi:hypothetical protein
MKFLTFVLVLACAIYGYYTIPPYLQKRHEHFWAAPLAAHIEKQTKGVLQAGNPTQPDEANFFWILFYLNKAESAHEDLRTLVGNACMEAELGDSLASVVKDSLLVNYEAAKKLRLFEEATNVIKLEQGEPALIKFPGLEDMKVTVGYVVLPTLAPEAANSLPNLLLLPEMVRNAQSDAVTTYVIERASAFENIGVIKRDSLERIRLLKPAVPNP